MKKTNFASSLKKLVLLALILLPFFVSGQKIRHRYCIGLTPTGNHNVVIDGLALGPMAMTGQRGLLTIRGLNIELLPISVFTIVGSTFGTITNVLAPDFYWDSDNFDSSKTHIYGVSFSGGLFEGADVHGFSFNLINSYARNINGVELSLFMNSNYSFKGIQTSMFGNRAVKGKGVQIGFFNSCKECNVIQIGLLNRAGKRFFPIINFSKRQKSTE